MNIKRRRFTTSLAAMTGALLGSGWTIRQGQVAPTGGQTASSRAASRLSPAKITKIRMFYLPNYDPNGPQAFPQSNMVVLVDTDAGITGVVKVVRRTRAERGTKCHR